MCSPSLMFFFTCVIQGDTSLDEVAKPKPPSAPWLADAGWKDLLCLATQLGKGGALAGDGGGSAALSLVLENFTTSPDKFKVTVFFF